MRINLFTRFQISAPLVIILMLLLGSPETKSQIPGTISYQGVVSGATGSIDVVFRLYASEVGGVVLWSESYDDLPVAEGGHFSVLLGSKTSFDALPFGRPYYIELVIDGSVLAPRTPMASSPYSRRASVAERVVDGGIGPNAIATGGGLPSDGEILQYDAANDRFRWTTPSGGSGGAIVAIDEGPGISVGTPAGPRPRVGILRGGVGDSMLADGAVKNRALAVNAVTTDRIKDSSITQAKFAAGVGLPTIGTAGGALTGNYPNPGLGTGVVEEENIDNDAVVSASIKDSAIAGDDIMAGAVDDVHLNRLGDYLMKSLELDEHIDVAGRARFGTLPTGQTPKVGILGAGNTNATHALHIWNSDSTSSLVVRNDGSVGIGTTTPGALLDIDAQGATALQISAGSTILSSTAVPAGPTIGVPAGTSIIVVTDDGVPGSPNTVTLPGGFGPGELLILINQDADALTFAGGGLAAIASGSSGIYVNVGAAGPGAGWVRIN